MNPLAHELSLKDSAEREDLTNEYLKTEYRVFKLDTVIRINNSNPIIDNYLDFINKDSFAFITAWNPQSKPLKLEENTLLNKSLKIDLSEYQILEGEGKGEDGSWPAEASYFVPGISKEYAIKLANKYDQKAFVFGERNKPSELIICN